MPQPRPQQLKQDPSGRLIDGRQRGEGRTDAVGSRLVGRPDVGKERVEVDGLELGNASPTAKRGFGLGAANQGYLAAVKGV